jgi:hypothetical protein
MQDNAGVILNEKGEIKGTAITHPHWEDCGEMWRKKGASAGSDRGLCCLAEVCDGGANAVKGAKLVVYSESVPKNSTAHKTKKASQRDSCLFESVG